MNDPQILDELDERGRTAGRDLLHRADSRTRPGFDTDLAAALPASAPDPRHLDRRPLLAVAAVAATVAALVGAAVWVGTRDDGGQTPAAQVTSDSIRPYLPTDLPGITLSGVAEVGEPGGATTEPGLGGLHAFGPSVDDPRLAVLVMAEAIDDDVPTIAVGDRTGRLHEVAAGSFGAMLEVPASASTTDSGVSTMRTLASGPVSSARTSSSSACSRTTASNTASPGIGTPAARVSTGRSAFTTRRSTGRIRSMYQPSALPL